MHRPMTAIAVQPDLRQGPREPRDVLPDRVHQPAAGDPGAAADVRAGRAAGRQPHAVGHRAGDDDLRAEPAGIRGLPVAAAGDHAVPAGAERGDHPADPHRRRPRRTTAARRSTRRARWSMAFSEFVTGGSLAGRRHHLHHHLRHQVRRHHQGRRRASAKWRPASRWTPCPASRWRSTPTSTPATSPRPRPASGAAAVAQEADFYGAMDGASKFVRGDAIAGIIITFVNILGGLYVGMVEKGWPVMDCLKLYTKLTIGDGLVSQLPAFIVSLGAGLIVTRTSSKKNLGDEMLGQIFAKPKALIVAAVFLGLMSLTGLPKVPLIVLGGCCGGLAWTHDQEREEGRRRRRRQGAREGADRRQGAGEGREAARPGHDGTGGRLRPGAAGRHRQGRRPAGPHQPDPPADRRSTWASSSRRSASATTCSSAPTTTSSRSRARPSPRGETYPEQFLAMDNGATTGPIPGGTLTTEPAFGLPAYWITEPQRSQAEMLNYTVVEATAVLATHLTEVIKTPRPRAAHPAGGQEPGREPQGARAGPGRRSDPDADQAGRAAEGDAEPAPRARAGARPGDDPGNARRLRRPHQGPGRAHRVRPQRPGPHDLQAVRGRAGPALVPDARPGPGRPDQRPPRAQRARHDQHDAAADRPADRAEDGGQGRRADADGPVGGDPVQPADPRAAAADDRVEPAAGGGAGVQRDRARTSPSRRSRWSG